MVMTLFFIFIVALICISIISGIQLRKKELPYAPLLFNVHKFSTLSTIVFVYLTLKKGSILNSLNSLLWIVLISTALMLVSAMITGGIMNTQRSKNNALQIAHKITTILSILGYITIFIAVKFG